MDMRLHVVSPQPRFLLSDREDVVRTLAVRRLILTVAKHRFARRGYAGTSLDDVRHGANLSWDEFRTHFESKRGVLEAVLQDGWKNIGRPLAEIAFGSPSGRAGLSALLILMSNVLRDDEDWIRIFLFEGRTPDPESGEIQLSHGYQKFRHLCTELVLRGQKDGSLRKDYHPEVVTSILLGAIEGVLRDRLVAEQSSGITPYSGAHLTSAFEGLVSFLVP